jgi:large subunit ribosomal protein L5
MAYTPRLKEKYNSEIVNKLKVNYKSVMQVPKLVKISLNQGVGNESTDKKFIDTAQQEMSAIAGQKALITKSRKDISNFNLRKGMPVGIMVTLRGNKMYEFLDRLISATLPRVRDFKGVPKKGFDGRGNYTLGIKEHIVFQEIDLDKINKITGMDITIVTDTNSDEEAFDLLKEFGMPFSDNGSARKEAEEAEQKKQEAIKREAEEAARAEAAEEEEKKEADRRAALSQEDRDKEDAEAKANEDTDSEENKNDNNEESAKADDSENK